MSGFCPRCGQPAQGVTLDGTGFVLRPCGHDLKRRQVEDLVDSHARATRVRADGGER